MNTVVTVLLTLGVDKTIWIQFAITLAFLVLAKLLFANDLMRVLIERVKGTSGAEGDAEKIQQQTEASKKRYEKTWGEKIVELNNEYSQNRKKIKDELDKTYKEEEAKVIGKFKSQMDLKKSEFTQLQSKIESETGKLAAELLEKIKR